jgi:nucleoside-diphosphate-sugar epimerase
MPDAAGKRYLLLADGPTITWLGLAEAIHDHLGAAGASVSLKEAPGDEPTPLTIHNDRAKQDLDWQPRAARTTITDTIDSLRQLGLLETR